MEKLLTGHVKTDENPADLLTKVWRTEEEELGTNVSI